MPGTLPRTGSFFGVDLDAIESGLGRGKIFAVYTFKLQRIRGICVQIRDYVVATQLMVKTDQVCREAASGLNVGTINRSQIIRSYSQLFRSSTVWKEFGTVSTSHLSLFPKRFSFRWAPDKYLRFRG